MSDKIVHATFVTRCGCRAGAIIPYPAPLVYYRYMKAPLEPITKAGLSLRPVGEVRVFNLASTDMSWGRYAARYEEAVEQRQDMTRRYTEEDLRWALGMMLTKIERRHKPFGALEMEEAIDIAKEILGEERPDNCLEHLFKLWQQGHKV